MTTQTKDNHAASQPTSTQRVYDAVQELRALGQEATRHTVAQLTGLKMSVVDDRLRTLVHDERLTRTVRGVYELAKQYPPPRPMFFGILADGFVKVEVGDDVLTLSPEEARTMGRGLGGFAEDARVLESTRAQHGAVTELTTHLKKHSRLVAEQVEHLKKEVRHLKTQLRRAERVQAGLFD